MSLSTSHVWFDVHQLLGADFDPRRAKAYVTTNVANGTLIDTSTGEIRMGDQAVTINADGTGSFDTWQPGPEGNPNTWQTSLTLDIPRAGQRDRVRRTFGPYTIDRTNLNVTNKALTSNVATITVDAPHGLRVGDTFNVYNVDTTFNGAQTVTSVPSTTSLSYAKTAANVASTAATGQVSSDYVSLALLEEEQAVPAEYLTTVTAQLDEIVADAGTTLDGKVAAAETQRAGAEAARDLAEQYRDEAHDISHIDTSDALVAALVPTSSGSATATALTASFETMIPVTRFGAAVDDTTDDTAALQAGMDATAALGATLYIPGPVRVTSTLTIPTGLQMVGGGPGSTIRFHTATANAQLLTGSGVSNVRIANLTINGGYGGGHTVGSSVRFIGSSDCIVEDCTFVNNPGNTVLVRDASTRCVVRNNYFETSYGGTGQVYLLTDVTDCTIEGNHFEGAAGGCIWLSGGVLRTKILRNSCDSSGVELIGLRYDCNYGTIEGNLARHAGDNGISVSGKGWMVRGNLCELNDHSGIGVFGDFNTITGNIVRNNNAVISTSGGIRLMTQYGLQASNNVITGNVVYNEVGVTPQQSVAVRLDGSVLTAWTAGEVISAGSTEYRTYGSNVYLAVSTGTTGATAPTHTTGDVSDGGVTWRYTSTTTASFHPTGNRIFGNKFLNHASGSVQDFATSGANDIFDEASAYAIDYQTLAFRTAGTERARFDSSGRLLIGGTTSQTMTGVGHPKGQAHALDGTAGFSAVHWGSGTTLGGQFTVGKSNSNTVGTQAAVADGTTVGQYRFAASDGTNFRTAAMVEALISGAVATGAVPALLRFLTTPVGGGSAIERLRVAADGALVHRNNATTIFDANSVLGLRSYSVAGLPAATTAGQMVYVSNESGGAVVAFSDGTNWRRVTDRAVVS